MRWRALTVLAVSLLCIAAARDGFDHWVAATDVPSLVVDTSVEVRDRDGALLRAYMVDDGLWRLDASLDAIDPRLFEMLIAYEDKRFHSHTGVDPVAMLRAAGQALRHGRIKSGGSTITMQVARLLEDGTTGRWAGKLRQIRLALALERRLTKREILTLYALFAPYGGNVEGVRAASLAWFGKEPARLTDAQAALLVALPQAPEGRRPDRHHDRAVTARNRVLDRLRIAGVVSEDDIQAAWTEPVPSARIPFPQLAPHVADRMVAEHPQTRQLSLTLSRPAQRSVEKLARVALIGQDPNLSIAIMAMDHRTGEVLASVGSAAYRDGARQGFVDMTRALRSPGSTLKPLVYGLAFDQGLAHPETIVNDRPVSFNGYAPQNFDRRFRGELRMEDALRLSLNIPVVLLTEDLGPERLMVAMRKAGMSPQLPSDAPGLAVALGGVGVTLEDMMRLYSALARGGRSVPLRYHANTGEEGGARLMSRASAWHLGHILSGLAAPGGHPEGRIAYKTGTSYGHRDAWAIGWDGAHVIGVWIGRADGTPVPGAFGADLAAPILFQGFQRLKTRGHPLPPPPPETILVGTARLPLPLQRFAGRRAVFKPAETAVKLAFPPDGARLSKGSDLVLKLRDGEPPFMVLANGAPVLTDVRRREIALPNVGPGYSQLTVIDAAGQSARARIEIR